MLQHFINPKNIDEETLEKAYQMVKEYCDKKGVSVRDFVHNEASIPEAAVEINKGLPFIQRKLLSVSTIESLIRNNIDFIREQAEKRA